VGLGSLAGLGVFLVYNHAIYGEWTLTPSGYGSSFVRRARTQSPFAYLGDIAGMLLHPRYSIFVFSPFLLFTLPGLRPAWRNAPLWVKSSTLAAGVYMLIHLRLNRFWGGPPFNYRYPLEMLTMMAPFLYLSWRTWWDRANDQFRRYFWYSVAFSAVIQALAIVFEYNNPEVM
jgi:hypothetical protein